MPQLSAWPKGCRCHDSFDLDADGFDVARYRNVESRWSGGVKAASCAVQGRRPSELAAGLTDDFNHVLRGPAFVITHLLAQGHMHLSRNLYFMGSRPKKKFRPTWLAPGFWILTLHGCAKAKEEFDACETWDNASFRDLPRPSTRQYNKVTRRFDWMLYCLRADSMFCISTSNQKSTPLSSAHTV